MINNLIQIAGIRNQEEARMLVDCGVDYLGFPLRLAVHSEDLSEKEAGEIIRSIKLPARGTLITYLNDADEILSFCVSLGCSVIQLHGEILPAELCRVRAAAPRLEIIKSLIVRGDNLTELKSIVTDTAPYVDAFFTDTFDPRTGASGATGKTHDWKTSRELARFSPKPLILAGGLVPKNVKEAILEVRPAGVDAHTGVEDEEGRKSRSLVEAFVSEAREGFELAKKNG